MFSRKSKIASSMVLGTLVLNILYVSSYKHVEALKNDSSDLEESRSSLQCNSELFYYLVPGGIVVAVAIFLYILYKYNSSGNGDKSGKENEVEDPDIPDKIVKLTKEESLIVEEKNIIVGEKSQLNSLYSKEDLNFQNKVSDSSKVEGKEERRAESGVRKEKQILVQKEKKMLTFLELEKIKKRAFSKELEENKKYSRSLKKKIQENRKEKMQNNIKAINNSINNIRKKYDEIENWMKEEKKLLEESLLNLINQHKENNTKLDNLLMELNKIESELKASVEREMDYNEKRKQNIEKIKNLIKKKETDIKEEYKGFDEDFVFKILEKCTRIKNFENNSKVLRKNLLKIYKEKIKAARSLLLEDEKFGVKKLVAEADKFTENYYKKCKETLNSSEEYLKLSKKYKDLDDIVSKQYREIDQRKSDMEKKIEEIERLGEEQLKKLYKEKEYLNAELTKERTKIREINEEIEQYERFYNKPHNAQKKADEYEERISLNFELRLDELL